MLIPRTSSEVTSEWLQEIFQDYVSRTIPGASFRIQSFELNPGTKPGENFNSDLASVEVVGLIGEITEDAEETIRKCGGYVVDKSEEEEVHKEHLENVSLKDKCSSDQSSNPESRRELDEKELSGYNSGDIKGVDVVEETSKKDVEVETIKEPDNQRESNPLEKSSEENGGEVCVRFCTMLKFMSKEIFSKEFNRFSNTYIKEMILYCDLYQYINKFQENNCNGRYTLCVPDLYYSYYKGEDFVLALKNMKYEGYRLNDKRKGLDIEHLRLVIIQIARWHALSYVYNEKYNLLKELPDPFTNFTYFEMISYIFEISLRNVNSFLSDKPEFSEFSKRLANVKGIIEAAKNIWHNKENHGIHCLVHGDLWNNNLLYSYTSDSEIPEDVSLVDWQMCQWNWRVIDLQYLLHTSTTYEVRKEYLEEILKLYYSTFDEIVCSLNFAIPNSSYEAFKKEFDDTLILGFLYGLCLTQGTLSTANENMHRKKNKSEVRVRSFGYSLKSKVTRFMVSLAMKPQLGFLIKTGFNKMLEPIQKELQEGCNEVMNSRVLGLLREADEKGILRNIIPLNNK